MLDYKAIEALYTVQELQSFEAAAKKLHITQSAVSQRIKGLESFYGEPVLIRTLPYRPTSLGTYLIGHYKRICLLEESLQQQIGRSGSLPHISLAVNRDSLDTWFLDLITQTDLFKDVILQVLADDQELTLDYFKKGFVSACLSTVEKAVSGAYATYLGQMDYLLVATPTFIHKYFAPQEDRNNFLKAPAVIFDKNDKMHEKYLQTFFKMNSSDIEFCYMPSVQCFKQYLLKGYAYGLMPKIDILPELDNQQLQAIFQDKILHLPLYWHYWDINTPFYKTFNQEIIRLAKEKLTP